MILDKLTDLLVNHNMPEDTFVQACACCGLEVTDIEWSPETLSMNILNLESNERFGSVVYL